MVYPHDIPSISIWKTWKSPKPKSKYGTLRQRKTAIFPTMFVHQYSEKCSRKNTQFFQVFHGSNLTGSQNIHHPCCLRAWQARICSWACSRSCSTSVHGSDPGQGTISDPYRIRGIHPPAGVEYAYYIYLLATKKNCVKKSQKKYVKDSFSIMLQEIASWNKYAMKKRKTKT